MLNHVKCSYHNEKNNPIIPFLCLVLVKQSPRGVLEFLADVKVPNSLWEARRQG